MPGIINQTTINLSDIQQLANFTEPHQFFIRINQVVYNGELYFILLWVTWIILYFVIQSKKDQPLINIMYSGGVVSLMSFMLRGVNMLLNGVVQGLLTDKQMWIFPILTIIFAGTIWAIKR